MHLAYCLHVDTYYADRVVARLAVRRYSSLPCLNTTSPAVRDGGVVKTGSMARHQSGTRGPPVLAELLVSCPLLLAQLPALAPKLDNNCLMTE